LLDNARSPIRPVRWVERLLDPLLRRFGGVHLLRDPLHYLGTVGLRVERCDRSSGGIVLDVVARKRGAWMRTVAAALPFHVRSRMGGGRQTP
jgi:hypothetical protein